MITEEQQRKVYEWRWPELKGKDWVFCGRCVLEAGWREEGEMRRLVLGDLYNPDGTYNADFWQHECVPRLVAEGCDATFSACPDGSIWGLDNDAVLVSRADPYAALVEYLQDAQS